MEKTICAISTPIGVGGISIIRISGADSKKIATSIFLCKTSIEKFEPRKMYLGTVKTNNFTDKAMCVYFKAPMSYTGEDIIEFHCHGGIKIAYGILQQLLENGASLAENGEFTKRAFLNGKLSLDEAEGVIDLINSESESQIRAGYNLLNGNLRKKIETLQKYLTDALASIEATLDYPDEDLEDDSKSTANKALLKTNNEVEELLSTANSGMCIKSGVNVAILGLPNVGKSSILNKLLGFDRAIVTSVQGTTRDILTESFEYNGVKFNITDTAGIRNTTDVVEQIGVNKAKQQVENADVILYILDNNQKLTQENLELMEVLSDKKVVVCINKIDLESNVDKELINNKFKNIVSVSAINSVNIEEIKQKLFDLVIDRKVLSAPIVISNIRHIEILKKVQDLIIVAMKNIENNSLDLVAFDIKSIWLSLGEITGKSNIENVINRIFEKFCLGK